MKDDGEVNDKKTGSEWKENFLMRMMRIPVKLDKLVNYLKM